MARPTGDETRSVEGNAASPAPARIGAPLRALRADAANCRACPLWRRATQTVFGEGPERASLMLVGEPEVIVCLGATAAQALLGPKFRVTQRRGALVLAPLPGSVSPLRIVATVHPSSILRAPDDETRERELRLFVRDLRTAMQIATAH